MTIPYMLMAVLFAALAVLAAGDSALTHFGLLPWFNGLRWLRVHFITLGFLTEVIFGLTPALIAARAGRPRPATRWDIWLALNAGLLVLLIGIPLVNGALIFGGGLLVFSAAVLLVRQLSADRPPAGGPATGRRFYLTGLVYLLVGITIGTGLWLGWGPMLLIKAPLEAHIHANNWGFLSLTFAGLIIDLYPGFMGRPLAWPRSLTPIFWMMTAGALLLVLSPWLKVEAFAMGGILLHLGATGWLLANVIAPVRGDPAAWGPGLWHLVTAYIWIITPVLMAPMILLKVPGFPGAVVEQNAPQALVYGWALQVGYALIPYVLARWLQPDRPARLGGSWFSLALAHLGCGLLWLSIFAADYLAPLQGAAYTLWALSLIPIVLGVWRTLQTGLARAEAGHAAGP